MEIPHYPRFIKRDKTLWRIKEKYFSNQKSNHFASSFDTELARARRGKDSYAQSLCRSPTKGGICPNTTREELERDFRISCYVGRKIQK